MRLGFPRRSARVRKRSASWLGLLCIGLIESAVGTLCPESAHAQGICKPPKSFFVCQDRYGSRGRAFLSWDVADQVYSEVRVYLDDHLEGTGGGDAESAYVTDIAPGVHTFAVEGVCPDGSLLRASMSYEILQSTPYERPIDSIQCSFDPEKKRLSVTWVPTVPLPFFIDVYFRRTGAPSFRYVTTLAGDVKFFLVDNALEGDRVKLQFFDAKCYGSELVACPGTSCEPPSGFKACQDLYAPKPRIFLDWIQTPSDYTAFELFLDGNKILEVPAQIGLQYLNDITVGLHKVGIRGICGEESATLLEQTIDVLAASPHTEPLSSFHCERDPETKVLRATWLLGERSSEFIDVYLRHPGSLLLDFVGTIPGSSTMVQISGSGADDELVLQLFDLTCQGSPLITCKLDAGSRKFLRGDANGSAEIDLTDSIFVLRYLFLGETEPLCFDAVDANDDGKADIADPIFLLSWLFTGGVAPPLPGPSTCGDDPTPDSLRNCLTAGCP